MMSEKTWLESGISLDVENQNGPFTLKIVNQFLWNGFYIVANNWGKFVIIDEDTSAIENEMKNEIFDTVPSKGKKSEQKDFKIV
jgi:hypothetical protein